MTDDTSVLPFLIVNRTLFGPHTASSPPLLLHHHPLTARNTKHARTHARMHACCPVYTNTRRTCKHVHIIQAETHTRIHDAYCGGDGGMGGFGMVNGELDSGSGT